MGEEKKTGYPARGENAGEGPSRIDEFVDKVEPSHSVDERRAKPVEKKIQETYSELNALHKAFLDDLESSMDQSMQELDDRYAKEFSRLDKETAAAETGDSDAGDLQVDITDARLMKCETKVEMLQERLERSESEVCKQCCREADALKAQLAAARQQLAEMKGSPQQARGSIEAGLSRIMEDMSGTVKSIFKRLRAAKETKQEERR